jgi:hypothetical protein
VHIVVLSWAHGVGVPLQLDVPVCQLQPEWPLVQLV